MEPRANVPLSWSKQDVEQRLYFPGGRFTRINTVLAVILAAVLTIAFYCALIPLDGKTFANMFTKRGVIPYTIVFFTSWSLVILILKSWKLRLQRFALDHTIVPQDGSFVLSSGNVDEVIDRIYETVDDPRHFVLFNRIAIALANLKNLRRVGDVDEILRTQAENDEASMDNSYMLVTGFVWAIPVLGFIGTVLGLSEAIGQFGNVLQASDDISQIKDALKNVTGGLSTAFVTTLQALVAALVVQLVLTFVKKGELEFLEECSNYCTSHVVNRLRLMPFERTDDDN